jgi:hypothetical protein
MYMVQKNVFFYAQERQSLMNSPRQSRWIMMDLALAVLSKGEGFIRIVYPESRLGMDSALKPFLLAVCQIGGIGCVWGVRENGNVTCSLYPCKYFGWICGHFFDFFGGCSCAVPGGSGGYGRASVRY